MINIYEPWLTKVEREQLIETFDSSWISSKGQKIKEFEELFAKFHNSKFAIACSSCTTALHLALLAEGIGPKDEVIVPSLTFIAPANMVLASGAELVLSGIDNENLCIDSEKLKKNITSKTKAIILVHQFGRVCNLDEILSLANDQNITVIEDCAESVGAIYKKKFVGTFGKLACFSFFGNKVITTGEGGMIITDSFELQEKIRLLRDHGMKSDGNYIHQVLGYNYRMTNMQAAIGVGQMKRINEILEIKNKQEEIYYTNLSEIEDIRLLPIQRGDFNSVNWLITITCKSEEKRDKLMLYLKSKGIETRRMIRPVIDALYISKYALERDEIADKVSAKSLHLPSGAKLTYDQILFITTTIKDFFK